MAREEEIKDLFAGFITRAGEIIGELTAERMIAESAINPILAKSLGFRDFESLSKFYVYQRIGRSLVTSFGMRMEKLVKIIVDGDKGEWWDVVKETRRANYYISVKSGPRDMNKDQTVEFSRKAKQVMEEDGKAHPFIAMGYGKEAWPVITDTLGKEGLDPGRHAYVGRKMYSILSGEEEYYLKLLDLAVSTKSDAAQGKTVVELIEEKVREISADFSKKYDSVDELLLDTF